MSATVTALVSMRRQLTLTGWTHDYRATRLTKATRAVTPQFVEIVRLKTQIWENMMCFPNRWACAAFKLSAADLSRNDSPRSLLLASDHGKRALRDALILYGRANKFDSDVYATLVDILSQLPPEPTVLTECALCGETPEFAVIKLTKCSGCKRVAYCSD
eukprot:gene25024-31431_t